MPVALNPAAKSVAAPPARRRAGRAGAPQARAARTWTPPWAASAAAVPPAAPGRCRAKPSLSAQSFLHVRRTQARPTSGILRRSGRNAKPMAPGAAAPPERMCTPESRKNLLPRREAHLEQQHPSATVAQALRLPHAQPPGCGGRGGRPPRGGGPPPPAAPPPPSRLAVAAARRTLGWCGAPSCKQEQLP